MNASGYDHGDSVAFSIIRYQERGPRDVGAAREGDVLVLRVRDSGAGLANVAGTGEGYGLAHVRERLATLYGERASFALTPASDAEGGTLATIRLPIETAHDNRGKRPS